jgi:hypothetical protein
MRMHLLLGAAQTNKHTNTVCEDSCVRTSSDDNTYTALNTSTRKLCVPVHALLGVARCKPSTRWHPKYTL